MEKLITKLRLFIEKLIKLLLKPVVYVSKRLVLPGFQGIPLYDVGVFFIRGVQRSSISLRANGLAFSFILAFVPGVLFLFTLIPYIPVPGLQEQIMGTLEDALPNEAFVLIKETIEDIVTEQRTGLLSISILLSIYFASNGIIGVMSAFNQSSHAIETRTSFKMRLISLMLVFILTLITIISAALSIFSGFVLGWLQYIGVIKDGLMVILLHSGSWIFLFMMLLTAFSSIYYLAPARRGSFRFISAGSLFASLLTIIFFLLFGIYVDNFGAYNRFYGSLATIFVVLIWLSLVALVLLIGFELNASIYSAKRKKGDPDRAK